MEYLKISKVFSKSLAKDAVWMNDLFDGDVTTFLNEKAREGWRLFRIVEGGFERRPESSDNLVEILHPVCFIFEKGN